MKSLPKTLHKNGFIYTQVKKGEKAYIYELDYNSGIEYSEGDIIREIKFYEVFKTKVKS